VQNDILANNSAADLRVYAVWFNMYTGDARWRWDGDGLVDPRVAHFWDEQKTVGNWFSTNLTHRGSPTWDFYALYAPDARDLNAPLSMGGTIINRRDQLNTSLRPLLENVPAL
jgi:hypothetical protein